jgi:hypothetical protein
MRRKRTKKWIGKIKMKKGALHRQLGIPEGQIIPLATLKKASLKGGKLGRRARFALTLAKLRHRRA